MLQAFAEESLNTLHFASMASKVKCDPVHILDPQDKLVLNLKGTIARLRNQNMQLASALQQAASGQLPVCHTLVLCMK